MGKIEIEVPGFEIKSVQRHGIDFHGDGRITSRITLELEPEWEWPSWIAPEAWLFKDGSGSWWVSMDEPHLHEGYTWRVNSSKTLLSPAILHNVDMPVCVDWTISKRQKPCS